MGTAEVIAFGSLVVALIAVLLSARGGTRNDAAESAMTRAKLDNIASGVDDIRLDMRMMRDRVDNLHERMAKVEASVSSAHKRIDQLKGVEP